MASSDSQIDKPHRVNTLQKRAKLLDVNINTGMQSINTEIQPVSTLPAQHGCGKDKIQDIKHHKAQDMIKLFECKITACYTNSKTWKQWCQYSENCSNNINRFKYSKLLLTSKREIGSLYQENTFLLLPNAPAHLLRNKSVKQFKNRYEFNTVNLAFSFLCWKYTTVHICTIYNMSDDVVSDLQS